MQAPERRHARRWGFIAACVVYVAAVGGATWLAFAAAAPLRSAVASKAFRAAMQAARHPLTQADLPRLLPGIPIYPGARVDPFSAPFGRATQGLKMVTVALVTPDPPDVVLAYYHSHMTGWRRSRPRRGGAANSLEFERGETWAIVTATRVPSPGLGPRRTVLTIHYHAKNEARP